MVSWSNCCHRTGTFKPVYGFPKFPLPQSCAMKRTQIYKCVIEFITTFRKGQGNPIRVPMICNRHGHSDGMRKNNQPRLCTGTGKSTLVSKICNVVDIKSLTLGWISLSLYKVVVDSYSLFPGIFGTVLSTVGELLIILIERTYSQTKLRGNENTVHKYIWL